MNNVAQTRTCTIGGTLTIVFANINSADLVKTAVLAAIGALTSYLTSQLVSWIRSRWKKSPP